MLESLCSYLVYQGLATVRKSGGPSVKSDLQPPPVFVPLLEYVRLQAICSTV